jgi:ATP-dependent Lon protease
MTSSSIAVRELPLFPLPGVILFPGRPLPLHIFEYRYRMLMNSILESDRRFGVLLWDQEKNAPSNIGCCAEIVRFYRLPDDRMEVLTLGQQRFRVLEQVREKPYRVGLVQWIQDEPTMKDLRPMTRDVGQLLQDVVRLSGKLTGEAIDLPDDLPDTPIELSYWIASNLRGVPEEQQALLEMLNTEERLERESEILTSTRNHLAARTVLKDTLGDSFPAE